MPRLKLQREPCDCLDCREGGGPPPPSAAAAAVARQEPPPKSLVLCLTNTLHPEMQLRTAELPHLHAVVRAGWAGLLACRSPGPVLPLQLLGIPAPGVPPPQLLPDRFKQLRAVLLTDTAEVAEAGKLAGCYAVHLLESPGSSWQAPSQLAARICRLLQVQPWAPASTQGGTSGAASTLPALAAVLGAAATAPPGSRQEAEEEEGDDVHDMVMVVLDAACATGGGSSSSGDSTGNSGAESAQALAAGAAAENRLGEVEGSTVIDGDRFSSSTFALDWADSLLSQLGQVPGFKDTVLLSLVVGQRQGQGCAQAPPHLLQQGPPLLVANQEQAAGERAAIGAAAGERLQVQRPLQSYQFAGLDQVKVDEAAPALVVHRLAGVIRVDTASALDLAEFQAHGAAGCILAERLLPEVAYKLGRAPKYGA